MTNRPLKNIEEWLDTHEAEGHEHVSTDELRLLLRQAAPPEQPVPAPARPAPDFVLATLKATLLAAGLGCAALLVLYGQLAVSEYTNETVLPLLSTTLRYWGVAVASSLGAMALCSLAHLLHARQKKTLFSAACALAILFWLASVLLFIGGIYNTAEVFDAFPLFDSVNYPT